MSTPDGRLSKASPSGTPLPLLRRGAQKAATQMLATPATVQAVSTSTWPPAPYPSKNAMLRSNDPPAPGGSSLPIVPTARGNISGAEVNPDHGLPTKTNSTAPSTSPPVPSRARKPAAAAATATTREAIAPTFAHQDPPRIPS